MGTWVKAEEVTISKDVILQSLVAGLVSAIEKFSEGSEGLEGPDGERFFGMPPAALKEFARAIYTRNQLGRNVNAVENEAVHSMVKEWQTLIENEELEKAFVLLYTFAQLVMLRSLEALDLDDASFD